MTEPETRVPVLALSERARTRFEEENRRFMERHGRPAMFTEVTNADLIGSVCRVADADDSTITLECGGYKVVLSAEIGVGDVVLTAEVWKNE